MASDSGSPEKLASLLGDLGKATLRGIRKCPKCGTYNGTRGISCKNKLCDAVFKERGERRKQPTVDAVKIITGSTVQIFSVRLRDRGPDYRGFVQLPLVQDLDGNPATTVDVSVLEQNSKCYVDTCLRALAGETWAGDCCHHIRAAIQCSECAVPLTLKNSVLNSLKVGDSMKQQIWLLATETTGPLVQRVTKNMMVVKCKAMSKHPLGFIHFAFFESKKKGGEMERRFHCSCRTFKTGKPGEGYVCEEKRRCVHFYACICAFASDEQLAEEFAYFINLDGKQEQESQTAIEGIFLTTTSRSPSPDPEPEPEPALDDEEQPVEIVLGENNSIFLLPESVGSGRNKRRKESVPLLPLDVIASGDHSPVKKMAKTPGRKYPSSCPLDESSTAFTFHQWLASVTERINQTMHYQFSGHPDPLVFHVPEPFFACLQQRFNIGQKKKRLPNSTTGFVRRDALPLGTFTKYTWHITNVIHVKQIFDTPEVSLELTRNFVENRDKTYDLYTPPTDTTDSALQQNSLPIRPCALRTYLKVGLMLPNQTEPTPFTIEWIPDILPHSHIGEMRIKFEYGHQRNGVIDRDPSRLRRTAPRIAADTVLRETSVLQVPASVLEAHETHEAQVLEEAHPEEAHASVQELVGFQNIELALHPL